MTTPTPNATPADTTVGTPVTPVPEAVLPPLPPTNPAPEDGKDEPKKKKAPPSIEFFYANLLDRDTNLAVGSGETPELFRWNGVFWKAQTDVELEQQALRKLADTKPDKYSRRTARSMVETAVTRLAGTKGLPVPPPDTGVLVPMSNGVLEILPTGVVLAHRPDKAFGVTHAVKAPVDWSRVHDGVYTVPPLNPDSKFGRFLRDIQPNPAMQSFMAECFGSTLSTMNHQRAYALLGQGSNGKSMMLSLLAATSANPVSFDLARLDGEFNTEPLIHATLITVPEAPPRKRPINTNLFKAWVARDPVSINRKNRMPITVTPRATWILSMNEPMGFSDMSHGFLRRIVSIPFLQTIPAERQIPDLDRMITGDPVEMAGVLDWLISGLVTLTKRGRFMSEHEMPAEVRAQKTHLRMANDTVLEWAAIADVGQDPANPDLWADKEAVYQTYREYCQSIGRHAVEANEFWKRLGRDLEASQGLNIGAPENNRRASKDARGNRARLVRLRADGVAPHASSRVLADPLPPQTAKQAAVAECVKQVVQAVKGMFAVEGDAVKQEDVLAAIKAMPRPVGHEEVSAEAVLGGVMSTLRLELRNVDGVLDLVKTPLPPLEENPVDLFEHPAA